MGRTFAPGTSPFRVKGSVYLATHEFFEQRVRGGMYALYAELRSEPELVAFLQQKFLPSSWYDVLPVARLIEAEARAMGVSLDQYLRVRTRYQADRDIAGVYRFIMRLVSPETVGLRLPRLIQQMFEFGSVRTTVVGPKHVLLEGDGWPTALTRWVTTAFRVYSEVALVMAGAKSCDVEVQAPESDGERDGVPLTKLRIDLRWEQ